MNGKFVIIPIDELEQRLYSVVQKVINESGGNEPPQEQLKQPLMTSKELSDYLNISESTLWRRVQDGKIPEPLYIGTSKRFDLDKVMYFLTNKKCTHVE